MVDGTGRSAEQALRLSFVRGQNQRFSPFKTSLMFGKPEDTVAIQYQGLFPVFKHSTDNIPRFGGSAYAGTEHEAVYSWTPHTQYPEDILRRKSGQPRLHYGFRQRRSNRGTDAFVRKNHR
jgi:hypothetical protein